MKKVITVILSVICLLFCGCEDNDDYVNLDQYVTYDKFSYYSVYASAIFDGRKSYLVYMFDKYYGKEIDGGSLVLEADGYAYYNRYNPDYNNFDSYIMYDYFLLPDILGGIYWPCKLSISVNVFDELPPPEHLQVKITYSFVGETEIHEEVADLDFTEQSLQDKYIKK